MGAQGTSTLDFGAHPGTYHATVAVTGQAGIVAGSLAEAWIRPEATADHTSEDHMVGVLRVVAADIIAGTGFTIHGFTDSDSYQAPGHGGTPASPQNSGLTGQWSVAWAWN